MDKEADQGEFEYRFGDRLRRYAEDGTAGSPSSDIRGFTLGSRSTGTWFSKVVMGGAVALTVALGAIVASVGVAVLGIGPQFGARPTPTPTPAMSAQPSSQSSELASVPPTLAGETPGPNAAAPSGALYISGVTLDQLVSVAESFGLSCVSKSGSIPGDASLYELVCKADIETAGYAYSLTAPYWTFDRISQFDITALQLGTAGDPVHMHTVLTALLGVAFQPSVPPTVASWFATNVDNEGCTPEPCQKTFTSARVDVTYGSNGARELTVHGVTASP